MMVYKCLELNSLLF